MKKYFENRLSMFYAVRDVCETHVATWTPLVPFGTAYSDFQSVLKEVENDLETQNLQIQGIAEDKAKKRDLMVERSLTIAQATYALAADTNNPELRGKVDYSRSDLLQVRDTVVAQRCQGIHTEASTVAAFLVPYGVTAADLTAQQAAIDAYLLVVSAPRTAITVRKGATAAIENGVRDGLAILNERMDKLMAGFKITAPDFHQAYFDARIIVDLGGSGEEEEEPSPTPPGP